MKRIRKCLIVFVGKYGKQASNFLNSKAETNYWNFENVSKFLNSKNSKNCGSKTSRIDSCFPILHSGI